MKEIKDFSNIMADLFNISECPNFSDEMRNKASDLYCYIKKGRPFEVGDWIKIDDSRGVSIQKVTWVSDTVDQLEGNYISYCIEPEDCKKLTAEQINILGLESNKE